MNPNAPTGPCRDPFDETLDAILSGDATERDRVILNDTLRADPDARRTYIRAMIFEGMLAREFAPIAETVAPRRSRWLAPLSIAATILLAGFLAWRAFPGPSISLADEQQPATEDEDMSYGVITGFENASGHLGTTALASGVRLSGGMLDLQSGLAEITFDSGAEVTLEGPARLEIESANKSRLDAGRASANVPEQARGFVLHTPTSYIRDLGTTFSVEVKNGVGTDLHILEGEVEVAATGRPSVGPLRILRQKEAVRFSGGGMQTIGFRPDGIGKMRDSRPRQIPPSVHWSFDQWSGSTTMDDSRNRPLELRQDRSAAVPATLDGPFGPALRFDGDGTFARSTYPGVGGSQPRTVACWVCVPPDDSRDDGQPNGIVSWGVNRSSARWQVAFNRAKGQGNEGAPRVELGSGYAIGSTDLRDGRWHHLAVVYLGGERANVATHVRIYVDGKLEPLTGRHPQKINAGNRPGEAQPLAIGRYLGKRPKGSDFFFEGDLDELHVFEGALLPGQIVRLMKRNSLPAPKN